MTMTSAAAMTDGGICPADIGQRAFTACAHHGVPWTAATAKNISATSHMMPPHTLLEATNERLRRKPAGAVAAMGDRCSTTAYPSIAPTDWGAVPSFHETHHRTDRAQARFILMGLLDDG